MKNDITKKLYTFICFTITEVIQYTTMKEKNGKKFFLQDCLNKTPVSYCQSWEEKSSLAKERERIIFNIDQLELCLAHLFSCVSLQILYI